MTDNAMLVLTHLKNNYGKDFTKQDIADKLGISLPAVTGTINSLTKRGFVAITHTDTIELEPATETRKAKTKELKYHTLTEAGLAYDPVAEEAEKLAAKEAAKAERAAARKAAKAAE